MALQLSTNNPYDGVASTAYWKITQLNVNYFRNESHCVLECWIDAQSRLDLKSPITSRSFDWSGDDFPFTGEEPQNEREITYEKIKTTDEFAEALDV